MNAEEALDRAWRSTCKILFGQEAGPLEKCEEWLLEYCEKIRSEKSHISKKEVVFAQNDYSPSARFISYDEIDYAKKFEPLSINEMKDIDSVVEALRERLAYAGNVVLGNSSNVQKSSNVADSHYVLASTAVESSKYIAYSKYVKESQYCFGLYGAEQDIHAIKCMGSSLKRCFECHMVNYLSDCYFCAKAQNCTECMFCFGMENGKYAIGNAQLPKEKYLGIKAKLLREIAQKIRDDGRIFSLFEILEESAKFPPQKGLRFPAEKEMGFDGAPIQKAFDAACRLIFGKEMGEISQYEKFLLKHVPKNATASSFLSNSPSLVCGYRRHIFDKYKIGKRIATESEMLQIGRTPLEAEIGELDARSLAEKLHPIAYINFDKVAGECRNFRNSAIIIDSQDCFEGSAFISSKRCAYDFWTSGCDGVFGSCAAWLSSYAIKNFYSKKMSRSLECDGCESCTDLYYSHNCENVRDSMFCFNAKNLVHAIGNSPLPADQYRKLKSALVSQLAAELEAKKDLKIDIFNVGALK